LERGLWTEIHNSRGVTWCGLADGGEQERTLAEQFHLWAEALQSRWFRTATLLHSVAESYERDARRQDADAEPNEDYWDLKHQAQSVAALIGHRHPRRPGSAA
jgi:hypothetical protein